MAKVLIKKPNEISDLRISGRFLTESLIELYNFTKPWKTLLDLEIYISEKLAKYPDYKWPFKWYNSYPANLCLSVNDCLVHGVPNKYILREWDLLKIDLGISYNRMITDAAISMVVWWSQTNPKAHKLIQITKNVLDKSLTKVRPGQSIYDYGRFVEWYVKSNWASVIYTLWWHGVWYKLHEDPFIFNYPEMRNRHNKFQKGMVVALEPILSYTSHDYIQMPWDKRSMFTKNWDLWSQWEYTVAVTEKWSEVLAWVTDNLGL